MNKSNFKLKERCEILEEIIISISDKYFSEETTNDQRKFIETTLGAAIYYLPHSDNYWTGKISKCAKEALEENNKTRLTKEHQFPRKIAAKELLMEVENIKNKKVSLQKLYEEKYAKFNFVTPQENAKLKKYQKDTIFINSETAYKSAGIELFEINEYDFKKLKKIKNLD
jgi:hypothetical protein